MTDDAEQRLAELRLWFHERGRRLYVEKNARSWIARYPAHGQSIGAGPVATAPTRLEAALAAQTLFLDGEAGERGRKQP
jgi:hypothetical protein